MRSQTRQGREPSLPQAFVAHALLPFTGYNVRTGLPLGQVQQEPPLMGSKNASVPLLAQPSWLTPLITLPALGLCLRMNVADANFGFCTFIQALASFTELTWRV